MAYAPSKTVRAAIAAALGMLAAAAAEPVPVKLAEIGVATTLHRSTVAPNGREAFSVQSTAAGQSLLVELNTTNVTPAEDSDRIQVFAGSAAAKPKALQSSLGDADNDRWLAALPAPGAYQIEIARPSKKPYELRVTLLDARDPRLDPGLTANQVSLNLAPVHRKLILKSLPFRPFLAGELDDYGPAHLAYQDDDVEVYVMSTEGFKRTFWFHSEGAKSVAALENALKPGGLASLHPGDLPGSMNDEAAITFLACRKLVEGAKVRAVRWVASYSQDETAPVAPVTYGADGISPDGRFLIAVRMRVLTHPALPKTEQNLSDAALKKLRARLGAELDAAKPDSFQPSLQALDDMLAEISLP